MRRLELTLVTNNPGLARRAEAAGIDRLMIDLELLGKVERQRGRALFLSDHSRDDIDRLRAVLSTAAIQVRLNPWNRQSVFEINDAISRGAQIVMLPMVRDREQTKRFVDAVNGRARVSLLIETNDALENCEELLSTRGVDEAHVGLNDLAIDLGREFIFDALADRLLDRIAQVAAECDVRFGFSAVAGRAAGPLPIDPEVIIGEQRRLGASVAWLGRSYSCVCQNFTIPKLAHEVEWIRETFQSPEDEVANFRTLKQQLERWKKQMFSGALAVAS